MGGRLVSVVCIWVFGKILFVRICVMGGRFVVFFLVGLVVGGLFCCGEELCVGGLVIGCVVVISGLMILKF